MITIRTRSENGGTEEQKYVWGKDDDDVVYLICLGTMNPENTSLSSDPDA